MDVHHLPFRDCRRARRGELRSLLDFNEAHAAHAGDRKPGGIAIVRNQNSGGLGCLKNRRAVGNADSPSLDRETDHLGLRHQATAAITGWKRLPWINASNSPRTFLIPETTGTAHESLSTQIVLPVICSAMSSSVSRSSTVPSPSRMRSMILVVTAV